MSVNLAVLSLPSACNAAGVSGTGCKYISGSRRSYASAVQDAKTRKSHRPWAKKTSRSTANMCDQTRQRPSSKTPPTLRIPASSAVGPNAHPDEDWTKITDLSERRRIQNRIAQRNFRQKMKDRVGNTKGARTSSAERSRERTMESREQDTTAQNPFAGHSTALSPAPFSATNPNVAETQVPWQQTPHSMAEPTISPPQLYSPPPLDYSFYTSSPEQYQATGPVYAPPPYQRNTATPYPPYIQYPGQPGYYTNQPSQQPSHSLQPPPYQQQPPQLYTPEPLPSTYDVDTETTSELDWSYGRSDVYQAGLSPQPYSYHPSPSGSTSGFENPDPRLHEHRSPRGRPHQ